ncbi:carotenoid biosynthesis protein [Fibrella sp. HMF5335]|uniref:Carotenoid biosynthesis protein n=1 Tax=Fibrella rubiginis TaxID=2817060 RepID=A0A939K543_9BACT|nr:carotenoid biosynthesis protein [Fibrella rubiginis]MBO0937358.1 carotenoid biosynthesis protein [Fibrella rubiginis]
MTTESIYRYAVPIRVVLVLAYVAGLIGLQLPAVAGYFKALTALNLLATLAVLLYFHTDWQPSFYFYVALAVLTGFFVEVLGVHTGAVFGGPYAYGTGLGPKIWGVPPVIGVNWLLLTYCFGSLADRLSLPVYMKAILAATGMVLLDFLIEPVAIRLDFWTWFGGPIPLQNYLGWWLVALVLLSVWYGLPFRKENRVAGLIISLQAFFFAGHNLLYYL